MDFLQVHFTHSRDPSPSTALSDPLGLRIAVELSFAHTFQCSEREPMHDYCPKKNTCYPEALRAGLAGCAEGSGVWLKDSAFWSGSFYFAIPRRSCTFPPAGAQDCGVVLRL
jgi:hypothetical protein